MYDSRRTKDTRVRIRFLFSALLLLAGCGDDTVGPSFRDSSLTFSYTGSNITSETVQISGDFVEMNAKSVANIIHRGGTILKTARSKEFMTAEGMKKAAENISSPCSHSTAATT